jgi:hypothetical protein
MACSILESLLNNVLHSEHSLDSACLNMSNIIFIMSFCADCKNIGQSFPIVLFMRYSHWKLNYKSLYQIQIWSYAFWLYICWAMYTCNSYCILPPSLSSSFVMKLFCLCIEKRRFATKFNLFLFYVSNVSILCPTNSRNNAQGII